MLNVDSKKIIQQIQVLVVTLSAAAIIILSLLSWDSYQTKKISDISSQYHISSLQDIRTIRRAILTIQYTLKTVPDNLYSELYQNQDTDSLQDITHSLHLIKQNFQSLYNKHKHYPHTELNQLVERLKNHIEPIINLIDNHESNLNEHLNDRVINTSLLILEQMDRLHGLVNTRTLQQEADSSRLRLLIILLLISITGGVIYIITRRSFSSIKAILKQQAATERQLRKEKKLIHTTLLSIGDAVITTDEKGLITNLNPVAETLTGWNNNEAQGERVKKIFPIFDASTREPIENPVEKVLQTGKTVYLSNHTTLTSRDGTEYQIADSAAPIIDNDEIKGMVLVFNDVTEQYALRESANKSRRDMQAIMDNTPALVYIKDLNGKYLYVNKKLESFFQLHRNDIIGQTDASLFPENIAEAFQKNDREVIASEQSIEREEIAPHDDGPHTYHSVKYPLFDNTGELYAICGISTDITKTKQQEEIIRRSQKMDALGKLVGGVAHDYNNMLSVVLGYANLLDNLPANTTKQKKYIHQIQHAADRGSQLTKRLLSFSSLNSEDMSALDINRLLTDMMGLLEKTLTPKIKIKQTLEESLWPIWIDPNNLEDSILNLAINAMHAIDGNGILTLKTCNISNAEAKNQALPLPDDKDYVLLQISDTGCGITDDIKEKIFDPFFTTKGEFGTGLGLSQVYGYIKKCGGTILVNSTPGEGSQFNLYFPRHFEKESRQHSQENSHANHLDGNENILLIDDEPALLEFISEALTQHGYTTFCTVNARQAMRILENEKIDLMLSDVIMPEIDGYQLASFVEENYPSVKIQLASGFSDDRHLNHVNHSHHKDLLHKPFKIEIALQRIRHLLDAKKTE